MTATYRGYLNAPQRHYNAIPEGARPAWPTVLESLARRLQRSGTAYRHRYRHYYSATAPPGSAKTLPALAEGLGEL